MAISQGQAILREHGTFDSVNGYWQINDWAGLRKACEINYVKRVRDEAIGADHQVFTFDDGSSVTIDGVEQTVDLRHPKRG